MSWSWPSPNLSFFIGFNLQPSTLQQCSLLVFFFWTLIVFTVTVNTIHFWLLLCLQSTWLLLTSLSISCSTLGRKTNMYKSIIQITLFLFFQCSSQEGWSIGENKGGGEGRQHLLWRHHFPCICVSLRVEPSANSRQIQVFCVDANIDLAPCYFAAALNASVWHFNYSISTELASGDSHRFSSVHWLPPCLHTRIYSAAVVAVDAQTFYYVKHGKTEIWLKLMKDDISSLDWYSTGGKWR